MDYLELKEVRSLVFIHYIYAIALSGFFRLIWGENWQSKLSNFPKIKKIQNVLRDRFFCYYVRGIGRGFVESKLPVGVILQPSDSLPENYAIYRSRVFDAFYDIRDGDVVIDIGAHVGIFTIKAARKAKNGVVVAVEPYLPNYKLLVYNINHNKIKNVIRVNSALSDSTGSTQLYISTESVSHTIHKRRKKYIGTEKYTQVVTQTLDELLDKLELPKVNFIKMNVEGAELSILKGAEKTL